MYVVCLSNELAEHFNIGTDDNYGMMVAISQHCDVNFAQKHFISTKLF